MTAETSSEPVTSLMNVGKAVGERLKTIGITTIGHLRDADPLELFNSIEESAGRREDPCLLDTLMAAIDQANGMEPKPWWSYTKQRKRLLDESEAHQ